MTFNSNAFSAVTKTFYEPYDASQPYDYDLKWWHMKLLNIGGQLMLLIVPLIIHSPDHQYFSQDYELYNQKYKTKCYLQLYCPQWIKRVLHHFY